MLKLDVRLDMKLVAKLTGGFSIERYRYLTLVLVVLLAEILRKSKSLVNALERSVVDSVSALLLIRWFPIDVLWVLIIYKFVRTRASLLPCYTYRIVFFTRLPGSFIRCLNKPLTIIVRQVP